MGAASDFDAASGADEEEREKRGDIAESLCTCGHGATSHAVDDEERRECSACACEQYEDLPKKRANDADLMRDDPRHTTVRAGRGPTDAMKPYYEHAGITIYHGDCREILPAVAADVLVTDPPYPSNAGLFVDAIGVAREVLAAVRTDALVFWSELESPPVCLPLVAVHIWHRTNVNGRPYEPVYHFSVDGEKKRSEVYRHAAVFDGVGPGCNEYLGHPTQKPVALMQTLIRKTTGLIVDPFCGSGATLHAARNVGRRAIGIEIEERYCEIAAKRLSQEVMRFDTEPRPQEPR